MEHGEDFQNLSIPKRFKAFHEFFPMQSEPELHMNSLHWMNFPYQPMEPQGRISSIGICELTCN